MDFIGEVMHEFFPADGDAQGVMLPWPVLAGKVRLRSSELSVWAGYSGHGKSMLLGQVMVTAAEQGDRVCVASLEMKARKTLKRLTRQVTGSEHPSPADVKKAMDWLDSKFLIYDVVGGQTVKDVLKVFAYVRKRYGVQHFVIDNLMMLDVSAEDKDSQTQVVRDLMQFKAKYDCHLHLVAHSRKGQSEDTAPRKLDIAGSSNIVNLADNVFIVWRNKGKEEGRRDATEPDVILYCDKQRDGEWEGAAKLWFERGSLQYRDREEGGIRVHDAMRVKAQVPATDLVAF
jgi:twinkle protein